MTYEDRERARQRIEQLESALRSLIEEYPFSDYPTPALDEARRLIEGSKPASEQDSPNDWPDP